MIKKEEAVLVAIDFQERLLPAMAGALELKKTVIKLVKGIKALNIPILVTQQYTKGLGPTIDPIASEIGDFDPIEKTSFSAFGEPNFEEVLKETGKTSVILCGIEAHVCVQQTALDLLERGYQLYVIDDCIASRKEGDHICSLNRMTAAGAIVTTYESILFELLGDARADGFKEISAIVK